MKRDNKTPGALAGATGGSIEERLALLEHYSNAPLAVHADEIRDMLVLADDLLDPATLTIENLREARACVFLALALIERGA